MKQVRIQPVDENVYLVDVVCDCGVNGLRNVSTNERSFKHQVNIGGDEVILQCDCGKKYLIHPQLNHFHVVVQ
jgi:hypothetical protein